MQTIAALILVSLAVWIQSPAPAAHPDVATGTERFGMRVVTAGLTNPWELVWGPDGRIWATERVGRRIVRINPADGTRAVAVTIPDIVQTHAQDGLLGLALHPGLLTAADVAASDWRRYEGKVLRMNLDGAVPSDNPVVGGVRSHVFSYGHRNAQGLAQAPGGLLYASEHGPSMDDELNVIEPGKHYGWPFVAGYRDDRFNTYNDWSASAPEPCTTLKFTEIVAPASVPQQTESSWREAAFAPPIRTFFTMGADWDLRTQGFGTIAPSGIDVYAVPAAAGGIPGWAESILVTSLTRGVVYRVKLGPDGRTVTGPSLEYFKMRSRYRDVLVAPDGRTIYVVADAGSQENTHSILAFTYQP